MPGESEGGSGFGLVEPVAFERLLNQSGLEFRNPGGHDVSKRGARWRRLANTARESGIETAAASLVPPAVETPNWGEERGRFLSGHSQLRRGWVC